MDFVQRNLINERNNLQIELAKANILIAQLSEGMQPAAARANDVELARLQRKSKIDLGVRGPHKEGEGITPAGEGAQQRRLAQQEKTFPMAEQAEYISSLENVIATIAESMNVSAADLYETYRITPARRDVLKKLRVMQCVMLVTLWDLMEKTSVQALSRSTIVLCQE